MNPFAYILDNRGEVLAVTLEHLVLVSVSMALALAIGLPLGIAMTRRKGLRRPILTFANLMQTLPSIALFGFLIGIPFIGLGARNAIVALVLYALLPIVRNTYIGIAEVDPAIREAATGMGMTGWQLLRRIEIPLAMGVIFAGIRVATVISVGLATLAGLIGAGGLGTFIFRGVAMVNSQVILAGAIPAAAMALAADFMLGRAERYWGRYRQVSGAKVGM